MSNTTLVTGLWDINRGSLGEGWSRSYEHYLAKFAQLLEVDHNLIIFGDEELKKFVFEKRSAPNTHFIVRDISWFRNNEFFERIQKIRTNPDWYNQASWLKDSTQAKLEMYNPLVMSKMFLLHDAKILDPFDSEYLFWIDAGLTNTVHPGYFTHDRVLGKLPNYFSKFSFITFPYEANTEIHGFEFSKICDLANQQVNKVARGGFFGGPKSTIFGANSIYYDLLNETLTDGLMGTEESLFTLMLYKHPSLFSYAEIEFSGLIGKFFEDLKNDSLVFKQEKAPTVTGTNIQTDSSKPFTDKSALYVLTFNSPKQFETLISSMRLYDENLLKNTVKFLIDNSTDPNTFEDYVNLCKEHRFKHIKKDNLGICGGRQFIAEHFAETDLEYMMFFEDDMFFYPHKGEVCKNGFNRYVENFYIKIMKIMAQENFDFLKFSFTEFYGNNSTQWSWYNVPQKVRKQLWPTYCKLPEHGVDPNSPKTVFHNIKSLEGLPYADGEVYYCNWPQIVSKEGSKKMFLEVTWSHPFEQTRMSHIYQKTKDGHIKPGLLLLSPTEHNRFDHYPSSQRKES